MLGRLLSRLFTSKAVDRIFSVLSGMGAVQWTPRNYAKFSEEGFKKNAMVFRCVSLISQAAASVPWVAYQGERELGRDHDLLKLLSRPNPLQGQSSFIESLVGFYLIAGNVYVRKILIDGGRRPSELYLMRPDRMTIETDKRGFPGAYKYRVGTTGPPQSFPVDYTKRDSVLRNEIMHIKTFNPLNDHYGLSPLEAAAFSVDQHNAAGEWNYKMLRNAARPSGLITQEMSEYGGVLTIEQVERIKNELAQHYQGTKNAGRPMVLEGGLKWQQMSLTPLEMSFIEMKNITSRDITQIYGVPPMIAGIKGDATFANYETARLAMWEDNVLLKLALVRDELNRWLAPHWGENVRLDFDADDAPALAYKRHELYQKLESVHFLSTDEKREAVGYDEVEGGEDILIPAMMVPLAMSQAAPAEAMPPDKAAEVGYGYRIVAGRAG